MKILRRIVLAIILLPVLLYACDWAVLSLRATRGTAFGEVQVQQFLATPLKGNKVEYDSMGKAPETCSKSLFPQKGNPACWWLKRHPTQWEE